MLRSGFGVNDAFQQRIARHAIGAVQAGAGGLSHRIEARNIGMAITVYHNTAAGIVGRRHYRYRFTADIDTQLLAARHDGGKVTAQEIG